MTSHPYRPMHLPRHADPAAVAAAHQAHRDARALPCPQCGVAAGKPCHGTEGAPAGGYSHAARRALTTGATP